jgi:antirestriction protein ArdC
MGKRFGDAAYAAEELVAEIVSAFLCAELGITQDRPIMRSTLPSGS